MLPPGPISRPIFSGSIFVRNSRGPRARCPDAVADGGQDLAQDLHPRIVRLGQRAAHDILADPVDLQIELDARDAVLRPRDLEVHVAEVVFVADDVGQQDPLVSDSLTSPIEMPATGLVIGTPAAISASVAPQTVAIDEEPFDSEDVRDDADRVGEILGSGKHRLDAAFRQRSVADFAPPWAADRADFAHGKRREVVVEHEFLGVLVDQPVHPLLVLGGSQRDGHQGLRFAALKHGRTVRPRQDIHMAVNVTQRLGVATVGTGAGQNQIAHDARFQIVPRMIEDQRVERGLGGSVRNELFLDPLLQRLTASARACFPGVC